MYFPKGLEDTPFKFCSNSFSCFWFSRFAFAETSSEAEIQTAIKALDSKEIHGRRLRVRSSKDKDNKQAQATQER